MKIYKVTLNTDEWEGAHFICVAEDDTEMEKKLRNAVEVQVRADCSTLSPPAPEHIVQRDIAYFMKAPRDVETADAGVGIFWQEFYG